MTFGGAAVEDLPSETKDEIANSFLRLRFRGGRFEGAGGMPLAAMSELAYLDELIQSVARFLWRKRMNKQRIKPADYPDAPVLRVQRFAKGSSIPLVERDGHSSVLTHDPYDESRDLVERTFWSIIDDSEIPDEFPSECYDLLRRVGKTLQPDEGQEYLEARADGSWGQRVLTQEVRTNFWHDFTSRTQGSLVIVGQIESLTRPGSFVFKAHNGQKLDGKCVAWDDMHKAIGKAETHPISRLYAQVEFDYVGRIRKIASVDRIEVFEVYPNNWRERFLELAEYQVDWVPGADTISASNLERTDLLMSALAVAGVALPVVFGTFDGGTNLVWDTPTGRVTIYVEDDEAFEVEVVPDGPIVPYTTQDADAVVAKVMELIHD